MTSLKTIIPHHLTQLIETPGPRQYPDCWELDVILCEDSELFTEVSLLCPCAVLRGVHH